MLVEYLFEIHPITVLLISISVIIFIHKSYGKSQNKKKHHYEPTQIEFKNYKKGVEGDKNSILVMSYNIMAYNFTKIEWFPYCMPEYLHPKYRAPRILNEIEGVDADVICLQECDHDLFLEFYKVNLESLGYTCIFKIASTNRIVTNVIAYKKKLFKQEKWTYLDLNEDLEKLDDSFQKHKEALFLVLKHINTGKSLVVVNTHLFWNPDYDYVKYGETSKIVTHLEKNFPGLPAVFCGDFNSVPTSNILKYIYKKVPEVNTTKGDVQKNKKYIELFWSEHNHNLQLRSAYDVYKQSSNIENDDYADNHPDFTTYSHEFIGNLDYIIYTQNSLELTDLLRVPTHDTEVKGLKLPNYKYPSDHLKIGAKFRFKQ